MGDSDNEWGGMNQMKEQERFLPIANVSRIMKKAVPGNAKISKDAKETVQECVSEFISFITGEASDKCQREKRKTINGDDLLWAMTTLGFEDYVEPLKFYLHRFRDIEGEKAAGATAPPPRGDKDGYDQTMYAVMMQQEGHQRGGGPGPGAIVYGYGQGGPENVGSGARIELLPRDKPPIRTSYCVVELQKQLREMLESDHSTDEVSTPYGVHV